MDRETAMGGFALSRQDPALVREAWAWRVGVRRSIEAVKAGASFNLMQFVLVIHILRVGAGRGREA